MSAAASKRDLLKTRVHVLSALVKRRGSPFVTRYLGGLKGIEIGASAHNNYHLDVLNVDRWDESDTPYVIEHFPDPIRALMEWRRVARRYIVAVVPRRDRTFDTDRPLSSVEELVERSDSGFVSDEDRHWSV